jgi:hypothetical protein
MDSDVELGHQGDNYEGDDEYIGSDDDEDDDGTETSLLMEFPPESVPRQLARVVDHWVAQFDEDSLHCNHVEDDEDGNSKLTDERNEESSDESCFGQPASGGESADELDGESDEGSEEDADDSIEDYQHSSSDDGGSDDDSSEYDEAKSLSHRLAKVDNKRGVDGEEKEEGSYSSEDSLTSDEDGEGDDPYESDNPFDEGCENDEDSEVSTKEGSRCGLVRPTSFIRHLPNVFTPIYPLVKFPWKSGWHSTTQQTWIEPMIILLAGSGERILPGMYCIVLYYSKLSSVVTQTYVLV